MEMKRKIAAISLAVVLCFGLAGCKHSAKSVSEWTKSDFSIYDDSGAEIDFPSGNESCRIYLSDVNEEGGGNFRTNRGAKIGMRATTVIENYNDSLHWFIQRYRSSTDAEKERDAQLEEKYPSPLEIVEHSPEFLQDDWVLYLTASFHEKEDGSLILCSEKDGQPCEEGKELRQGALYTIEFEIKDEKIIEVVVERDPSFKEMFPSLP